MDKRIVYTRPDGGISIIVPAIEDMDKVREGIPGDALNVLECLDTDIPADRTFRNAWVQGMGKLPEVDMPKARLIKMAHIRKERDSRLEATDEEMRKLDHAPPSMALKNKRQALRDLPQDTDLDSIITPEDLKAFEPSWP